MTILFFYHVSKIVKKSDKNTDMKSEGYIFFIYRYHCYYSYQSEVMLYYIKYLILLTYFCVCVSGIFEL